MDALQFVPVTLCLGKATLAAGTTSTLSSTGTLNFAIRGKAYSHAALSNTATPTTDAATGLSFTGVSANQGTVIVIGFNAAGTLIAAQGAVQALDVSGNFLVAPSFPSIPDTMCPIGYEVIKAGATAVGTWTFGTNNQAAVTGITYTLVDVVSMPDRPQVS
jgi:hypothetical protein